MAKKVKCPGCGAKNDVGQHRCRVCTTVIDPNAAEGLPKGLAKQAKLDKKLAAGAAVRARNNAAVDPFAGLEAAAGSGAVSVPAGPIAEPARPPFAIDGVAPAEAGPFVAEVPAPPVIDEPIGPAPDLPPDAIVIEAAPRHVPAPAMDDLADPVAPADSWDAVAGIEIDVVGRHAAEVPPPIEHADEGFDPDALIIDPPS